MKAPPYLAIAQAIRDEIVAEGLAPHSRLPSEPDLVRRYGVARATVRRALARLQEEGLIYSRQAVGTFVAAPRVQQDLDQLLSFSEFMIYRGLTPGTRIITAEIRRIAEADSPVLHSLQLKPGAKVVFLRRLRLGSGEPLVIANTWLPESRFPGFLQHDLERHSVYEIMDATGLKPTDAIQSIEAATLGEEESRLLSVPKGSAVLLICRVGYAHGVPVEYAVDYYRGDRTKFRVRLGVLEKSLGDRTREDHISV